MSLLKQISLRNNRLSRTRSVRPVLEAMEDRLLLYSTLGGQWVYGSRITYSFVPDGTNVGGVSSNLFSTMNAVAPTATWEQQFEKAAAIWSSYAKINLALVSDDGTALGASGNQQDDPRFGDIRIAAYPQPSGTLAYASAPPPLNGGTDAGDIEFNSNIAWKVNDNYDIETVALHEMGHSLGLDHSAISSAVMYAYYNGIKSNLTTDDVSGIQSLYGSFPSDSDTNRSVSTATDITALIDANSQIAISNLSLSGTSDKDYFVVTVPTNTSGTMSVSMQSTNLSSVSPNLLVSNSQNVTVGSSSFPNSFGATATCSVNNVSPGQVYRIRTAAASGFGSFGAYGLLVNFSTGAQSPIQPPNTVVASQSSQGAVTAKDQTRSVSEILGEMVSTVAVWHANPDSTSALNTLRTDVSELERSFIVRGANDSLYFQDLQALGLALALDHGNSTKVDATLADLFSNDVVQTGSLFGFGDTLKVSGQPTVDPSSVQFTTSSWSQTTSFEDAIAVAPWTGVENDPTGSDLSQIQKNRDHHSP